MKSKSSFRNAIGLLLPMMLGVLCAWALISYGFTAVSLARGLGARLLLIAMNIACVVISFTLHVILHEAGHLVFGLFSGYKFSSFRIFSIVFMKGDDGISVKRFSIAGTAGQCLMIPPDMKNGKIPVALYNLGGSLMNIIGATSALTACLLLSPVPVLNDLLIGFSAIGYLLGAMNGIPIHTSVIDNDGYNAISLRRDPEVLRAFWLQMKMNEMISHGARLKDMPNEWFSIPSDESMKNGMVAAIGVFACNRMVDEGRLDEAECAIKHITGIESGMAGVHRALLRYDAMFLELMGDNRPTVVSAMLSEADKKIIQSMKSYPAVIRTDYALALLGERNAEKAQNVLQRFEECASRHPYEGDIESERELIASVQNKAINAN